MDIVNEKLLAESMINNTIRDHKLIFNLYNGYKIEMFVYKYMLDFTTTNKEYWQEVIEELEQFRKDSIQDND